MNNLWNDDAESRRRMEAEDYEDDEDMDFDNNESDDEDEEDECDNEDNRNDQNTHLKELRRQAMIESLIGMGFPVDWALRAAEHCDVSTSESAAISWIIERMEMEQSKMEEMEGDSSRVVDEEEFDENDENGLDYFMQRHAAAFDAINSNNAAVNAQSAADRSPNRRVNIMASETDTDGIISNGSSPNRTEVFGMRRGLNISSLGVASDGEKNRYTTKSYTSQSSNAPFSDGLHAIINDGNNFNDISHGISSWNCGSFYLPVLIGQYATKRRHDIDKQEVLSQLLDLEFGDILPITVSCEFALCVYYSRVVVIRLLQRITFNDELYHSIKQYEKHNGPESSTESFVVSVLNKIFIDSDSITMINILKACFRQNLSSVTNQPDRILPSMCNANSIGDSKDKLPPFSPFESESTLDFHRLLASFELSLFNKSSSCMTIDDVSYEGLKSVTNIIYFMVSQSSSTREEFQISTLNGSSSSARNTSTISSGFNDFQDQVLRGVGVNLLQKSLAEKFDVCLKSHIAILINDCLEILETAAISKFDSQVDWIVFGLEKDESLFWDQINSNKPETIQRIPEVLWAYWCLRTLLLESQKEFYKSFSTAQTNLSQPSNAITFDTLLHYNYTFGLLLSTDVLSRLLKITSASKNMSMKFLVFDLCSIILFFITNLFDCHNEMNIDQSNQSNFARVSGSNIIASEYCLAIEKETRLMQLFEARLKLEKLDKKLVTRYSKVIGLFISHYLSLKYKSRSYSFRFITDYLMYEYSAKYCFIQMTNSRCWNISVSQLSSNSVTVSWNLIGSKLGIENNYDMNSSQVNLYIGIATSANLETPIVVSTDIQSMGSSRIDDLEPG